MSSRFGTRVSGEIVVVKLRLAQPGRLGPGPSQFRGRGGKLGSQSRWTTGTRAFRLTDCAHRDTNWWGAGGDANEEGPPHRKLCLTQLRNRPSVAAREGQNLPGVVRLDPLGAIDFPRLCFIFFTQVSIRAAAVAVFPPAFGCA